MIFEERKTLELRILDLFLYIIMFIILGGIVTLFYLGLFGGNQWFTREGIQEELIYKYPNVQKVIHTERNWIYRSIITVTLTNGLRKDFLLDSDILYRYELTPKP
jgi:hypothetical protein